MASRKLSDTTIQALAADYQSGINIPYLSKKYSICTWSICNYLNRAGINRRTSAKSLEKLTDVQQLNVVARYKDGQSLEECAKIFNVSSGTISRIIKKYTTIRLIRHKFDENFFSTIDSPIKAYWFGFLGADGYAKKSGQNNHVVINLKEGDIRHLEKFKSALKSDHNIKLIKPKNNPFGDFRSVRFEISSKKMVEDLHKNGLYRFKTDCEIPTLPAGLMNHFLRGFFDGDGWIGFSKNRRDRKNMVRDWARAFVGFCGEKAVMQKISDILYNGATSNQNNVHSNGTIFRIQYAGCAQVYKIAKWLYNNSTIETRLDRKYNIFLQLKDYNDKKFITV